MVDLPPGAADDAALLRRHAPLVRYDRREPHRATAVEALVARMPTGADEAIALRPRTSPPPDVTYGRAARGSDGRTWLQYWFLYEDNPQDRGIVRTGRHEGDWEVVQLRLGAGGRPDVATFAQHSWAEACRWRGTVYVAHGSHASYARAGTHDRPWPDPDDEAPGDGRAVRPEVRPFGRWVRWPGRWGRSEAGWVPGESTSPRGPAFQPEGPWSDPARFHAAARPCGSGAPGRPWPVDVGFAAVLLAIAAVGYRTRRRSR